MTKSTFSNSIYLTLFTNVEKNLVVTSTYVEPRSQYVIPANTYYTEIQSGDQDLWYSASFWYDNATGNGRFFSFIDNEWITLFIENMNVKSI